MNDQLGNIGLNVEAVMEHWIHLLSGKLPMGMLPVFPGIDGASDKKKEISLTIPNPVVEGLKKRFNQSDMEMFVIWLAAINAVLFRYTGDSDFMTGTTPFGIKVQEENVDDSLLFIFGNLSQDFPFCKVIDKVKRWVEEVKKYQEFPFDTVYDILKMKSGVAEPDIFHIAFIYEKFQCFSPLLEKFDFLIRLEDTGDRLVMAYNPAVYKEETILYFTQSLFLFFGQVLENIELTLNRAEIVSVEQQESLDRFNNTSREYPHQRMFVELFQEQVEKTPHRIAAVCGDLHITYDLLNRKSNRLAHLLHSVGVQPNVTVAVLFERSIHMLTAILAVLKAGGAFVPLDIEYPRERISIVLSHSNTSIILTDCRSLKEMDIFAPEYFPESVVKQVVCLDPVNKKRKHIAALPIELIDTSIISAFPDTNPENINHPNDMAYIMFVSGPEGKPTGVIVENSGLINHLFAKIENLVINADSIISQNASHCLDISVWQFLAALIKGGKTVIFSNQIVFQPQAFLREAAIRDTTVLEVVPTYLSKILDTLESDEPSKHTNLEQYYLLAGNEADKFNLTARWFQLSPGISVINAYGSSDTEDDHESSFKKSYIDKSSVPTGQGLQNIKVFIVNDALKRCPIGVTGEICIAGVGVGRGFLNDPELTAEKFIPLDEQDSTLRVPLLYKTGDLGRLLPDGTIEFMGRKDLQVRIRGFRIELKEIESRLEQHPGVKEAVIVDREDILANKYLCAYFIPVEEPDIAEFKIFLAERFPEYMIPDYFIRMDRFPRFPNGKVNRGELPSPGRDLRYLEKEANPTDEIETKLLEMWIGVLGKENIRLDDNFFDVGGTSLNGMEIIHMARKRLKVEIPLQELFRASTIRAMAAYIREYRQQSESPESIIPRSETAHSYPLTFAQERLLELSRLDTIGTSLNMPAFFYITGTLEFDRFSTTINDLIQRQKVLRTYFKIDEESGESVQCILPRLHYRVDYREAEDLEFKPMMYKFVQPFQVDKPPLFRMKLVKMPQVSILIMDFHRLIFDEASLRIFIQDFIALYNGNMRSTLRIRYHDFAVWQRHRLSTAELDLMEQYWLVQYRGSLPELKLPLDFPRPTVMTFKGAHVKWHLGSSLTEKLRRLARENQVTLHMMLLAIYNLLLAEYSGQSDISVATLESGRHLPELQGIVGMFANILVMRNFPRIDSPFLHFLEQVKTNTIEAYENADYPFEGLVKTLQLRWGDEKNPLADTVLIMENIADMTFESETINLTPIEHRRRHTIFDITLYCRDTEKEFQFSWLYKTALFKRETIQQMAVRFSELIETVVEHPGLDIHQIIENGSPEEQSS